ncbi:hypothetical protein B0T18DRAFT_386337 [Schizothecium vesticola]|uniref:Uncharacterized protein n=1 Tax=Schizothecium vesticola TaxID=314040 RepID=A0AA40FB75_9PEZI|nr:hypothetical protein B0T18DRAFT_386337 [Schizothecium vesticola]
MHPTLLLASLLATAPFTLSQHLRITSHCPSPLTLTPVNHPSTTGPLPLLPASDPTASILLPLVGAGVALKITLDTEQPGTGAAEVILGYSIAESDGRTVYYSLDQVHGELFPGRNVTNAVGVWGSDRDKQGGFPDLAA